MIEPSSSRPVGAPGSSPSRVIAEAAGLLAVIVAVGAWIVRVPEARPAPEPRLAAAVSPGPAALPTPEPPTPEAAVIPDPEPEPVLTPPEPEPVGPDPAVLAEAEAELRSIEEALRVAEQDEARLASELEDARLRELAAGRAADESSALLRAESERLAEAIAHLDALESERDRLQRVIAAIGGAPKPREALNKDRSPVARTIIGEEYHFEVRGDRVAFIDLDRLLEKAQADARLRLRMSGPSARSASGTVGPIGWFSLSYQVGATGINLVSDLRGPSGVSASFGLQGFEVVPTRAQRGEPFELAFSPTSEFGRVISRLNPGRTTITLWVYPDGFPLYRRLWDALHAYGFTVAARPLPEGMPIRGGPNGSRSAGQ